MITPRVSRLRIICEGQNRLSFQQDKRDYFLNDCIIGRLCLEEDTSQLCKLSVSLVRKDEFRVKKEGKSHTDSELIDFINLDSLLKSSKNDGGEIFFSIILLILPLKVLFHLN